MYVGVGGGVFIWVLEVGGVGGGCDKIIPQYFSLVYDSIVESDRDICHDLFLV